MSHITDRIYLDYFIHCIDLNILTSTRAHSLDSSVHGEAYKSLVATIIADVRARTKEDDKTQDKAEENAPKNDQSETKCIIQLNYLFMRSQPFQLIYYNKIYS